ncbi:transketolase [Planctomycetales bacterium]|nr:transketolase [Planctomycetales bacterium]GHT00947.1 transketolase [Planctomycetales bacterium]GHT07098.1 transketolase [Planctomycetales bacterium]
MSRTLDADLSLIPPIAETIRWLAADAIQAANSGHPGLPMGCADLAAVLLARHLIVDPDDPKWSNRDRFILSAGHGSALLYSMLTLNGFITLDDLKQFRQFGSKTPGHPEIGDTPGVDFTTGPLGAGFAASVGFALAERMLSEMYFTPKFPELFDHYTYVLLGDGCQQEGISQEAASLAGHLRLGHLIAIYDSNGIQLDGATSQSFTEDVKLRYEANRWHVQEIDGHDHAAIDAALVAAKADPRPSLIVAKTIIGKGSPHKQGTHKTHGMPIGAEEIAEGKKLANWSAEPFYLPPAVAEFFAKHKDSLRARRADWNKEFAEYADKHPAPAKEYQRVIGGELPLNWKQARPEFPADEKGEGGRVSGAKVLAAFGEAIPELVGGSADLVESTKTEITKGKWTEFVAPGEYLGRNIHFGVREHAMGQICNGLAAHGGLIPFCSTFFVFSDYLRPAVRLAALSKLRTLFIFTHDSIYVGEDGPTHEPVEQLAALRCIPNVNVFRPADANEAAYAFQYALARTDGPTVFALSRQNLPALDRNNLADARNTLRGGYILEKDPEGLAEIFLIASGSELHLALAVAETLRAAGRKVRVVSMPSLELFKQQPESYRRTVLPQTNTKRRRCVIEAGVIDGWEGILDDNGLFIGMNSFGLSGKPEVVAKHFGFTVDSVLDKLAEAGF